MTETRTTCPYCGVGCGVRVRADRGRVVDLRGDEDHPANRGRLCGKGATLAETLGLEGRLLQPEIRGRRVDWDAALAAVSDGFREAIETHGPESVAFYVSGQMLTEDYYVANKLMKGGIGAANIDTNSRLCMASSVAGHKRAFGADTVPGCYEDLDHADLIVLVGSNTAWCHPIVYQRISRARESRRARVVVIDPRRTVTCEGADLHLPLRAGTDVALFNGLLAHLVERGAVDRRFVSDHTHGLDEALGIAQVDAPDTATVARRCGLPLADVEQFLNWFRTTERVVTIWSQGVNQSSRGTDKVNAILNCHLVTGRIGRPGMGPFSVTGQPNAMGGREVGGLANQLAAHMGFEPESVDRVRRFWDLPNVAPRAGLTAVDLFRAVGEGRIKALWVMATNPAVSLPDAESVRAALGACPFVVVSDCVRRTDTTQFAHVLLPAAAWGEKDGTVTNSERRISRQRSFLPLPGMARPDWWIVTQVAHRLGLEAQFPYQSPAEIFREHAALSAFENDRRRDFDIGALTALSDAEYDALEPVQWPIRSGMRRGTERLFADGIFFTPDGRARFAAVRQCDPVHVTDAEYSLVLNTGRIRDQWHTMTRTGEVPRLWQHMPEPVLDIHPRDARQFGISDGGLADLTSRWGAARLRVRVTRDQAPGNVFAPMHWSDTFAQNGAIGRVVNAVVDPVSGQPELKHTPVRVAPATVAWSGFLLSRREIVPTQADYWTKSRSDGCWVHELAGAKEPDPWEDWAREKLGCGQSVPLVQYQDSRRGAWRWAWLEEDRLEACLFVARGSSLPPRDWLVGLFGRSSIEEKARRQVLSGFGAETA